MRVPENAGMEEIPESQARKSTPLKTTLKGEDMWDLEMARSNKPLPGLEIPPGPQIHLAFGFPRLMRVFEPLQNMQHVSNTLLH